MGLEAPASGNELRRSSTCPSRQTKVKWWVQGGGGGGLVGDDNVSK